jgi:hypothetical protein
MCDPGSAQCGDEDTRLVRSKPVWIWLQSTMPTLPRWPLCHHIYWKQCWHCNLLWDLFYNDTIAPGRTYKEQNFICDRRHCNQMNMQKNMIPFIADAITTRWTCKNRISYVETDTIAIIWDPSWWGRCKPDRGLGGSGMRRTTRSRVSALGEGGAGLDQRQGRWALHNHRRISHVGTEAVEVDV